jgi:hypothetical protein
MAIPTNRIFITKQWAKKINYDLERIDEVPSLYREWVREYIEGME